MPTDLDTVSKKEILAEISRQLHKQNQLFAQLVDEPQERPELYKCEFCDGEVRKDNRETHLSANHNPPSGVDIDKRFTKV